MENLALIENITSFGQFGPNYGQFIIFTFIGTLFDYTYPFDYPYHKVDNYVLFRFEGKLDFFSTFLSDFFLTFYSTFLSKFKFVGTFLSILLKSYFFSTFWSTFSWSTVLVLFFRIKGL